MHSPADLVAILLVLAAGVSALNQRFVGLPRAIALLLASLGVSGALALADPFVPADLAAWARDLLGAAALPQVLLDGVLGLLLFAASLHVDLGQLHRQQWTVLVLATASVIVATLVFGGGLWVLFRLGGSPVPLGWCLVAGAVLAPTDAVVVETLLRRAPIPAALKTAISGESLFNDGAGVVLFQIMLGIAEGEHGLVGHGRLALALAVQGIGGGALGCAIGWLVARAQRRIEEPGLRLMISLALATGTYRLADLVGVSGPTAVVACGLAFRAGGRRRGEADAVAGFWLALDDVLNAMLFLLIGFEMFAINPARIVPWAVLGGLPLALLSRLAGVVPPVLVLSGRGPRERRAVAMLTWAGLRGGVSLALALSLPPSPYHGRLLVVCYAVVVSSLLVQGLTMPRVIRALYGGGGTA